MSKYKEEELWNNYKETGARKDRTKVVMALQPILYKKYHQLAGSLPEAALKAEIAKHAVSAVDNYDPNKGAKLSTHVFNHIAQASRLNYTYQNMVRMSEDKQQGKYKHYRKALDDLSSELLRDPKPEEIAARLGWTLKEVEDMRDSIFSDIFEGQMEFSSAVSEHNDDSTKLNYIKSQLKPEELSLFNDKTGGMSQADMAKKHGMVVHKLNYSNQKLKDKVQKLLENYDG